MKNKGIQAGFVESLANNEKYQAKSLEELENEKNQKSELKEEESTLENGEYKQKGKKNSIIDIMKPKPEGKMKGILVPESVHRKVQQLSSVCPGGISDVTCSILLNFIGEHKDEIKRLIQRQMKEEWK